MLPLSLESALPEKIESQVRGGVKILIVDDEPVIIETVEAKFRKEGFTTFSADSAMRSQS